MAAFELAGHESNTLESHFPPDRVTHDPSLLVPYLPVLGGPMERLEMEGGSSRWCSGVGFHGSWQERRGWADALGMAAVGVTVTSGRGARATSWRDPVARAAAEVSRRPVGTRH